MSKLYAHPNRIGSVERIIALVVNAERGVDNAAVDDWGQSAIRRYGGEVVNAARETQRAHRTAL